MAKATVNEIKAIYNIEMMISCLNFESNHVEYLNKELLSNIENTKKYDSISKEIKALEKSIDKTKSKLHSLLKKHGYYDGEYNIDGYGLKEFRHLTRVVFHKGYSVDKEILDTRYIYDHKSIDDKSVSAKIKDNEIVISFKFKNDINSNPIELRLLRFLCEGNISIHWLTSDMGLTILTNILRVVIADKLAITNRMAMSRGKMTKPEYLNIDIHDLEHAIQEHMSGIKFRSYRYFILKIQHKDTLIEKIVCHDINLGLDLEWKIEAIPSKGKESLYQVSLNFISRYPVKLNTKFTVVGELSNAMVKMKMDTSKLNKVVYDNIHVDNDDKHNLEPKYILDLNKVFNKLVVVK